jgi:hypothetical protein
LVSLLSGKRHDGQGKEQKKREKLPHVASSNCL